MRRILLAAAAALLAVGVGCSGSSGSSSSGSGSTGTTGQAATTSSSSTTATSSSSSSSTSSTGTSGSGSTGSTGSGSGSSGTASGSGSGSGSGSTGSVILGGRTVQFAENDVYVSEHDGGETAVPIDPSAAGMIAVVVFDDGGSMALPATPSSDGGAVVTGLPDAGGYFFTWSGTVFYTYSDQDAVDVSFVRAGRPDTVALTQSSILNFDLANLQSWQKGDSIEVTALGAGGAIDFGGDNVAYADGGVPPFLGDTALQNYAIDWANVGPQIEAAKGDSLYVAQLTSSTVGTSTFTSLGAFFDATGTTLLDGQTAEVDGGFIFESGGTNFTVQLDAPANGATESAGPDGGLISALVDVQALPRAAEHGQYASTPDLLIDSNTDGTLSTFVFTSQYTDPYPAPWTTFALLALNYGYTIPVPGAPAQTTTVVASGYQHYDTLANLGTDWTPTLTAPRNLEVNGQSASADLTGVGNAPLISWDAPATGTPTAYQVELRPIFWNVSSVWNFSEFYNVGMSIWLPGSVTSVRIPDPLPNAAVAFSNDPNNYWYVRVTAWSDGSSSSAPFLQHLPIDAATTVSRRITP